MNRKRFAVLALVLTALSALGGTLTARWLNKNAQPAPPLKSEEPVLTVDSQYLDFGTVWENPDFRWSVSVHNPSTVPVFIEKWEASCDCTDIEPKSMRLEPGERKSVELRIDLSQKLAPKASRTPVSFSFAAATAGGLRPTWAVHGTVKPILTLDFPATHRVSEDDRASPQRFELNLAESIQVIEATCNSPQVRCEILPGEPSEPRKRILVCRYTEDISGSRNQFAIRVRGQFTSGQTFSKRLEIAVVVVPDIQANPPEVVVTGLSDGAARDEVISFQSVSGSPFVLVGATANGTSGLVVPHLLSAERLTLSFRATAVPSVARETVTVFALSGWRLRQATIEITITP